MFAGLGVYGMAVVVGVAVATTAVAAAVASVVPVAVSLSSMVVSMVMCLMSKVAGGASVVGVPDVEGSSYDNPCTAEVEGGVSRLRLGGSLDGVVVGVVVGWVAGGGAPDGGEDVEL